MILIAEVIFLMALLPAITWVRPDLRYPSLLILVSCVGLNFIWFVPSSTNDWVRPFMTQDVCPLLAGYIISELMQRRQLQHKKGART